MTISDTNISFSSYFSFSSHMVSLFYHRLLLWTTKIGKRRIFFNGICRRLTSLDNATCYQFKNAPAFLLRDARHAMHDILLLRISAILPEAISDGRSTPPTDTDLLLATYRGGSHLTSDISFRIFTYIFYLFLHLFLAIFFHI